MLRVKGQDVAALWVACKGKGRCAEHPVILGFFSLMSHPMDCRGPKHHFQCRPPCLWSTRSLRLALLWLQVTCRSGWPGEWPGDRTIALEGSSETRGEGMEPPPGFCFVSSTMESSGRGRTSGGGVGASVIGASNCLGDEWRCKTCHVHPKADANIHMRRLGRAARAVCNIPEPGPPAAHLSSTVGSGSSAGMDPPRHQQLGCLAAILLAQAPSRCCARRPRRR